MIGKQHTKLRYEQGYWDELDPFYDFARDDADFVAQVNGKKDPAVDMDVDNGKDGERNAAADDGNDDDDEDEWEDMPEADNNEESDEMFQGFEKEIARFGLDVTPLGELVFPDGRVVGHRALSRYYKQRIRPSSSSSMAVVAAQRAAGERVFAGHVININQPPHGSKPTELRGAGKGILVPLKQDGAGGAAFSTLSLYRYRAAVRKQRLGDEKGRRLLHRTKLNMNKMDKKHNRLTNGVSVAHAPR
jgi:pre-60S factor REI1